MSSPHAAGIDDVTRHWAKWKPAAVALVFGSRRITWRELDGDVDRLAAGLLSYGFDQGDRLGILARNCPEWCVLALAAIRCGGIVVPINERFAAPEVEQVVTRADCAIVAVDEESVGKLARCRQVGAGVRVLGISTFDGIDASLDSMCDTAEVAAEPARPTAGDDVVIIAYTSGSTGLPKGAMLTHASVLSQATSRSLEYGWDGRTLRTLLCVPLSVVGGVVTNFLLTLVSGGCLYLERDFEPGRVLDLIQDERISNMIFVPTVWELLARHPDFEARDLSSLDTAITGGAPVPTSLLRRYQAKGVLIHQSYGLTESTSFVSDLPPDRAIERNTSAGFPGMHTRVRILDDAGDELRAGEVGEIVVCSPTVMKGYWRDDDATRDAIRDGWLYTGDLGYRDDEGLLYIVDRKKEMYISGGFNVYPAEVERAILDFAGVRECAVFPVEDAKWGEAGIAVVAADANLDPSALTAHLRGQLASYKLPRQIIAATSALPRSLAGKVLRQDVRDQYQSLVESG